MLYKMDFRANGMVADLPKDSIVCSKNFVTQQKKVNLCSQSGPVVQWIEQVFPKH